MEIFKLRRFEPISLEILDDIMIESNVEYTWVPDITLDSKGSIFYYLATRTFENTGRVDKECRGGETILII